MKKMMRFFIVIAFFVFGCKNKAAVFLENVDEVKLYSYPSRMIWDTIKGRSNEELKFEKGKLTFDKTKVIDSLILNNDQKSKVFEVLLDTKYEGMIAACYEPRHLFIFYKNNKMIGYYEVCLECGGWKNSEKLNFLPDFCMEKGEELKNLFIKMKLKNSGEGSSILDKLEK